MAMLRVSALNDMSALWKADVSRERQPLLWLSPRTRLEEQALEMLPMREEVEKKGLAGRSDPCDGTSVTEAGADLHNEAPLGDVPD